MRRDVSWLTVGVVAAATFFCGVVLVVALRGFEGPGADTPAATAASDAPRTVTAPPRPTTPDVTGLPLDAAASVLEDAGLDPEVDRGGGAFGVVVRENWRVVEQQPAAGSPRGAAGSRVALAVERR